MDSLEFRCRSKVAQVTVYASGAQVTRSVDVSGVPSAAGDVTVVIPGVSPFATSATARAGGGRRRVGMVSLVHPVRKGGVKETGALKELDGKRLRLKVVEELRECRKMRTRRLMSLNARLSLGQKKQEAPAEDRIRDLATVDEGVSALVMDSDRELRSLAEEARRLREDIRRLELESSQGGTNSKEGCHEAEVRVTVQGVGALESLEVTYCVPAARWWPAYSASFSEGGTKASLAMEAFIVQASGEDWMDVPVALSTADMLQGTELPRLDSLRLGRAQAKGRKSGFRAPPDALDALFRSWDDGRSLLRRENAFQAAAPSKVSEESPFGAVDGFDDDGDEDDLMLGDAYLDGEGGQEEEDQTQAVEAEMAAPDFCESAPPPWRQTPVGCAAVPAPASRESGAPRPQARKKAPSALGAIAGAVFGAAGGRARVSCRSEAVCEDVCEDVCEGSCRMPAGMSDSCSSSQPMMMGMSAPGSFGASLQGKFAPEITSADEWMDFDSLTLSDPAVDAAHRGRLVRGAGMPDEVRRRASEASGAVLCANPHPKAKAPDSGRGAFDYLYRTQGRVDVPSGAVIQRIPVLEGDTRAVQRLVAAPVMEEGVYREAILENPFRLPLLGGPLDVSFAGTLLATDDMTPVGKGGEIRLGLGQEDRVKVVRNARSMEVTKGVLGGETEVHTQVEISVRSMLAAPVDLVLMDRVPFSGSDGVTVVLDPLTDGCVQDSLADRGAAVQGGLRWSCRLGPGEARTFRFGYRITFSSKYEIQGGNRRD